MTLASGEKFDGGLVRDADGRLVVQIGGTDTVTLTVAPDADSTPGSAVPAKGIQITGTDGTNARVVKTDTAGALAPQVSNTNTNGSVAVGVTSSTLFAANSSRKGLAIVNDSANTIYLGLGRAAALTGSGADLRLAASGGTWDGMLGPALWTGSITAISGTASSNVTAVEAT